MKAVQCVLSAFVFLLVVISSPYAEEISLKNQSPKIQKEMDKTYKEVLEKNKAARNFIKSDNDILLNKDSAQRQLAEIEPTQKEALLKSGLLFTKVGTSEISTQTIDAYKGVLEDIAGRSDNDSIEIRKYLENQIETEKGKLNSIIKNKPINQYKEESQEEILQLATVINHMSKYNIGSKSKLNQFVVAYYGIINNFFTELKSYNQKPCEYSLNIYHEILKACESTAAITIDQKLYETNINGTGFLISNNLVLTARHVIRTPLTEPEHMGVHFYISEFKSGMSEIKGKSFKVKSVLYENDALDIAVLCIEDKQGKSAADYGIVPLKLSDSDFKVLDQICALGHNNQKPLKIVDNGRVILPHRISYKDLLCISGYMLGSQIKFFFESADDNDVKKNIINQLTSYKNKLEAMYIKSGNDLLLCKGITSDNNCIAVFGAEIDGMRGISGGPVFNKSCPESVAGVYVKGAKTYTWITTEVFETIIPAFAIIEAFKNSGKSELQELTTL